MMTERIVNHPILGQAPSGKTVTFTFNDTLLQGLEGEPIAAALLANDIRLLRRHEETGSPHGFYCAIGHCMECRVHVEGLGTVRACITPVAQDMKITEGQRLPNEIAGRVFK